MFNRRILKLFHVFKELRAEWYVRGYVAGLVSARAMYELGKLAGRMSAGYNRETIICGVPMTEFWRCDERES